MTVKITETVKGDITYKNLKASGMLDQEYVIFSKRFADSKSGESQYGTWYNYGLDVHEFVNADLKAMKNDKQTFQVGEAEVGYFARESVHNLIKDIPVGVRIKMFQREMEGKPYRLYHIEILDNISTSAKPNAKAVAPEMEVGDKIREYKKNGVSLEDTTKMIQDQYDSVTGVMIEMVYKAA